MLRTRSIRPGIVTNEKLAELGPYATLLFERLWMLADREGRIEYRPERIRAECFPYWPSTDVEKLVDDLCKSGFLQKYTIRAVVYILVRNFLKHQHINPHEAKSVLPAPLKRRNGRHLQDADARACNDMQLHDSEAHVHFALLSSLYKEGLSNTEVSSVNGEGEKPEDPPPPPSAKKPKTPKRREPGKAATSASPGERPMTPAKAVDFWPHSAEGVASLRALLGAIGQEARLAPPDDEILRRTLDAARGATAEDVYRMLRHRWQRGRFRSMQSWGLLPLVVGSGFKAA